MEFDKEFVDNIVKQDELSFARFYEQSVDVFFSYVSGYYHLSEEECEDILSSFYLKLRGVLHKYDEKYSFGQFVRGIFKNHCKDYFKKIKPVPFSHIPEEIEGSISFDGFQEDAGELFDFSVDAQVLQDALYCLDRESQELIYSRYVLQYDYTTMADMFSVSVVGIRKKISRIIKKLRKTLAHTK